MSSKRLVVTLPADFDVKFIINGLELSSLYIADVDCNKRWCTYIFDDVSIVKMLSSDCYVVVRKYYTTGMREVKQKCQDFVELVKMLSEEE